MYFKPARMSIIIVWLQIKRQQDTGLRRKNYNWRNSGQMALHNELSILKDLMAYDLRSEM